MQKKSKIITISIVAAILLIIGVFSVVALTGSSGNDTQTAVSEKLSFGQKFLLDLEYDKAVAEFQAVIDIEPKNVDAYIGLAEAYIGLGEEEKAIETLEKGFMETGDEKIRAKLDEMKKPEETTAEVTTTLEVTTKPEVTRTPPETTTEETTTTPEETTTEATTTTPEVTTTAETTTVAMNKIVKTERKDYDDGTYGIYEYDLNDNLIKVSDYNKNGTLSMYYLHEYDSKGNCIKLYVYKANGSLDRYYIYEYHSDYLLRAKIYNSNKFLEWDREFYKNGNIKKTQFFDKNGTSQVIEYDTNERVIKFSSYKSNTLEYYVITKYDDNGNEIRYYYNARGVLSSYSIPIYDANGNEIKMNSYSPDGTLDFYYIYEYDSAGNCIKESCYNADGTPR